MKVAGTAVLNAPVAQVWDALLDPQVLVRTIPGCESLRTTAENEYAMTVTAGVASIKGTYAGTCSLSDLKPHESLLLRAEGSGGPGTVAADVTVSFGDRGDGTTTVDYAADAVVGGMIGGVGQRMLTSVSRRMAGEFFSAVDKVIRDGIPAEAPAPGAVGAGTPSAAAPSEPGVFTAPAKASALPAGDDFVKGAVVGGTLVLLGVLAGGLLGRRR
ncbi:MAG: carbon monoxide dehydrogenase subunit G [Nocardioidaceae bacterium]|nr:carbon monoxide dehydrogenase subunit G [Nocardioidaceae bacterium]